MLKHAAALSPPLSEAARASAEKQVLCMCPYKWEGALPREAAERGSNLRWCAMCCNKTTLLMLLQQPRPC